MKLLNRSSKKQLKPTIIKPVRLISGCVAVVLITLFAIHWVATQKEGELSIESSSNNKTSVEGMAERNKVNNDQKGIKSDNVLNTEKSKLNGTEAAVMKISATPDELILGMSRSELDAFHKRQTLNVEKQLSNPETKVELPPSDDILPPMTLGDLNALHKQQTIASKSKHIEFVQPDGDGTNEARAAVMTLDEVDRIHKEQSILARSDNQLVELPPVSPENEFQPLTLDQLGKMHSRQQLAADFNQVDDTKRIIFPPSDDGPHCLTNWGLIELHAQQEELSQQ